MDDCFDLAPSAPMPARGSAMRSETKKAKMESDAGGDRSAPAAKQPGQPTQPTQPTQQGQPSQAAGHEAGSAVVFRDYTKVPKQMDEQFERLAPESALRPTILNVGSAWSKRSQRALLAEPTSATLGPDEQKSQKDAAFDLLDAITKSGALPLSHASLHIVIAATHCFDKTVTETVVQENCNPIERVERSSLIMASTVHQEPARALVNEAVLQRVAGASPQLLDA
ncbi:unnamed protein product [Effrenium voratum]|nr:unnamed protein product [Effrenium voratum]